MTNGRRAPRDPDVESIALLGGVCDEVVVGVVGLYPDQKAKRSLFQHLLR